MTDPYAASAGADGAPIESPVASIMLADVHEAHIKPIRWPTDGISDGYHTFGELYAHRRALTAVVATIAAIDNESWRSKAHHPDDDPMFDGHFIVGMELPTGPVSYHFELKHWDDFAAVPEVEHAPKWDGHTSADVVERLDGFTLLLSAAVALGVGQDREQ